MISRLALSTLVVLLVSCQSKPTGEVKLSEREVQEEARLHQAGLVTTRDLKFAAEWEKLIHVDMGVRAQKIEVQAGPGYTSLTIRDLKNRGDAEGIAQGLRDFAAKNAAKYGIAKVAVNLPNAATTINPFSLPTEMTPATVSPGSVLPTLSLPPFQPAAR